MKTELGKSKRFSCFGLFHLVMYSPPPSLSLSLSLSFTHSPYLALSFTLSLSLSLSLSHKKHICTCSSHLYFVCYSQVCRYTFYHCYCFEQPARRNLC